MRKFGIILKKQQKMAVCRNNILNTTMLYKSFSPTKPSATIYNTQINKLDKQIYFQFA